MILQSAVISSVTIVIHNQISESEFLKSHPLSKKLISNLPKAPVLYSYDRGGIYYQFSVSAINYLRGPQTQNALISSDAQLLFTSILCELLNDTREISPL